jgi:adenylate cyclase
MNNIGLTPCGKQDCLNKERDRKQGDTSREVGMRGTTKQKAFQHYLDGERLFSVVSKSDMKKSRDKFRLATDLDPKFARAWGWRSYTQVRSVLRKWLPERALTPAREWAERAVGLDPLDYATHWDLGFYHLNAKQFGDATECYERGIELFDRGTDQLDRKPGFLAEAAEAYIHTGNSERAIELLERAVRVPDWYRWNLGWAYYQARRYDEALAVLRSMRSRPGDRTYVPEIALFIIAANYRKAMSSRAEGHGEAAAAHMDSAVAAMQLFRDENPDFALDDAVAHRSRFQNKADEEHWVEPLRNLWHQSGPGATRPRPRRKGARPPR